MSLFFYAAAAVAYDRAGLEADEGVYVKIAEEVCLDYTDALRAIAVENEPNPAKLNGTVDGQANKVVDSFGIMSRMLRYYEEMGLL